MPTDPEDRERLAREVRCPFCGFVTTTTSIGAIHCGPHVAADGVLSPAVQMVEVVDVG